MCERTRVVGGLFDELQVELVTQGLALLALLHHRLDHLRVVHHAILSCNGGTNINLILFSEGGKLSEKVSTTLLKWKHKCYICILLFSKGGKSVKINTFL